MLPLVDYSSRKKEEQTYSKNKQLISLNKMNQCVPSWELEENPPLNFRSQSNSLSLSTPDVPTLDYEVAELTWENGQISMHGLGPPRAPTKTPLTSSQSKYTWEKPRAGGTLESIVDQATFFPHYKFTVDDGDVGGGLITSPNELVPWLIGNHNQSIATPTSATATASATLVMDAMVPCDKNERSSTRVLESGGPGTRVESCSGAYPFENGRVPSASMSMAHEWSSCPDQSITAGSATLCRDSRQVTLDTCDREFGVGGFTSTSLGSPENTSSGKQCTEDDHDSVCHSRPQKQAGQEEAKKKTNGKSSGSTKRSRAAAVHNQSERKRRDKINQRMKTLQKLVPNSSKTDKASMLDEVIEYLKQLQAQVNMMSRMNVSPMMLPLAVQQQLQMSMMAPMMGMGMGMGSMGMGMGHHVMDMSAAMAGRPNLTGMSPVLHPSAFISPLTPWEGAGDQRLHTPPSVMHDMPTFLGAYQSQPMTMDAYSRMMAMYQQLHQNAATGAKN